MIIYSKSSGTNNGAIGKLETPIKMIIEHESDLLTKKGGICSWLFNVERSNRFGETIVTGNEFDVFQAATEGNGADIDSIEEVSTKFIEHIQFMKEFAITAEMMEDANFGIATDAKRRAENFTRAYYKTMNKICEAALIHGDSYSFRFANANLNLTTGDEVPLFHARHKYGKLGQIQANCFYGDIFNFGTGDDRKMSVEVFEEALAELSVKLRNMKDENGDPLGYTADTLIIPGNKPGIEMLVKKMCGTYAAPGTNNNDINLHYGNWNIVILPNWQATRDEIMIMSSEANKNLSGNMFFNRVPLTVTNWVDYHTGNYIWNGRCRFGVGFGTYKHIIRAIDATSVNGISAEKL